MNNLMNDYSEILTQLTTGPSLREVASTTLKKGLYELYPDLDINPDLVIVNAPQWHVRDGEIIPGTPRTETLTGALARSAISGVPVTYLDREHFLLYPYGNDPDAHLPVRVDAVGRLINELAPLLFVAFQEQQLDYWNRSNGTKGPRWQTFAQSLREIWNVQKVDEWDADDYAVARLVYHFPDYAERLPHDKYGTRTYLVDIDTQNGATDQHICVLPVAVLVARHGTQPLILTYSITTGYAKFASLEDFSQSLPGYLNNAPPQTLTWRLVEPDGNFFEHQAFSLIGLQIAAIGDIDLSGASAPALLPTHNLNLQADELSAIEQSRIGSLQRALPSWLLQASENDKSAYGRCLMDLAALTLQTEGKAFNDELPTLTDFARQALRTQLVKDHPEASHLDLDRIEITVTSQVVWGTIAIPGETQTTTLSLLELALQNLIALPLGNKTVNYRNGAPTPAWMTVAYLEKLITQVDIGKHYPEQVNTLLLADPVQSAARQRLYAGQLRLQLPLLALQCKIRHQFNIDELGYRYVRAVMFEEAERRQVDGYSVEIRPLALRPKWRIGGGADRVDNMFIIGPKDPKLGPCLLYRPLSDAALMQFPSQANLLYAIKQDTPLRQSVLAWLPDNVRLDYAQFVFPGSVPSPWILPTLLSEPVSSLVMSGPIEFTSETLDTDPLTHLYNANARALATLADRQSVSNAEARWESLKHAGWLALNAALPFLGRTAGAAAWLWQLMDDLQHIIDAKDDGDPEDAVSAAVDFFLNLGMALALHASLRHTSAHAPEELPVHAPKVPAKPLVIQNPTLDAIHLPAGHEMALHTSGALTRHRLNLSATLDSFSLAKPDGLGEQITTPGLHLHLYPKGTAWYAPVAQRWFEVGIDENETVIIIDPKNPGRTGPPLINNRLGQWFIDTRLRLRGGGLRSRRQKGQRLRPPKISELREQLDAFDDQMTERREELVALQTAIKKAKPADRPTVRNTYLAAVKTRFEELDLPIAQLKSLNILDTVPNYEEKMLDYLGDQVILARSAIAEQMTAIDEGIRKVSEFLEYEDQPVPLTALEDCRRADTSAQDMIERLNYFQSRAKEVRALGVKGVELIQRHQSLLPDIETVDLKAFRITLARFLCLTKNPSATARLVVNQIVDNADLAVQSLSDTLVPENPATQDEQIQVLDSLVDQFARLDQSIADLPADFPKDVHRPALENLQKLTEEFAQQATKQLTTLLRERKALEPATAGPSTSRPLKKVIKTRFRGVVVGEVRPPKHGEPTPMVEVKQPLTGKVIALFHEKEGVWVERDRPTHQSTRAPSRNLTAAVANATSLLDDVEHFIERTKGLAGEAKRLPVEIEERFHHQAAQLEQASRDIESALTASNVTESGSPSAALTNRDLDSAIKRLYVEGHRLRLDMLKQRPPTAAHVELLYLEKEITIKPLPGSRSKLAGRNKGYLKEYEILDSGTGNALWYAHFHYKDLVGPEEAYTAAHLKTKAQRRLGGKHESPGKSSDRDNIAVYRSEIGPLLARSLFFQQATSAAPES